MSLDVVIPVYGDEEHPTVPYLFSTVRDLFASAEFDRLILVDDFSDDETARALGSLVADHTRVTVVRRERRGWFTRAANSGLRESEAEWIVLLNSDVQLSPGWLQEMFFVLRESGASLVGSQYWKFHEPACQYVRWSYTEEPGYVTGHCWLLSRECFERVGYLDETRQDTIHINSDKEYCWALNRAGLRTAYSYWSPVVHLGHKSWGADLGRISRLRIEDVS